MKKLKIPHFSRLSQFAFGALVTIVVLTFVWSLVANAVALPVAYLCAWLLESFSSSWVQFVEISDSYHLLINTSMTINNEQTGWRLADVLVEIDPARYGYSLPILLALIWVMRGPDRLKKSLYGIAFLLPFHIFSIFTQSLMQICLAVNLNQQVLNVNALQMDAIAYGYQLGALMVPVLSPFLIWLCLDWPRIKEELLNKNKLIFG